MNSDWMSFIKSLNSAGFSPAILLVAFVLIWNGRMVEAYTSTMMRQVKLIHEAQLLEIERNNKFEEKTNRRLQHLDARLISMETQNQMLGFPLYTDEDGKIYFQGDK